MNNRLRIALLSFYAAMAIATFGHAAAAQAEWYEQHCFTVEQRLAMGGDCIVTPPPFTGIVAGALWPLYWSWELWE